VFRENFFLTSSFLRFYSLETLPEINILIKDTSLKLKLQFIIVTAKLSHKRCSKETKINIRKEVVGNEW
jgi:hypothetical protein